MTRLFILLLASLCASLAHAARLELPLRVPLEALGEALAAQLSAASGGTGTVYREGRCRFLKLGAPAVSAADGRLRLVAPGSAALGVDLLGLCQNAAAWRGTLELTLVPLVEGGKLRLRVAGSRLVDSSGSPSAGFIWEMSKRYVHPRLERFSYDFGAAREALLGVVRSAAPAPYSDALQQVLERLEVQQPKVAARDIVVPVSLEIPDAWLAAPAGIPSAPLSEAELEALDQALEPWDAFLAYTIKELALDSVDPALRARLFTLLLDSRYRLSALLSGDEPTAADPLPALFVAAWIELRAIIADAEGGGLPKGSLVRYAAFADAGDALVALERAAPGLQARPSLEGLRRLARSLRPAAGGDPLAFDWGLDAQLRALFAVPEIAEPPRTTSWLDLIVRTAHASDETALDKWVPKRDELDLYEARVARLLGDTAARELKTGALAAPYDAMYAHLVPATALIESCWRQYVRRAGKITYLRSASRSVGMMQINQRVWRGFYDVQRLRWDTAYNVRAGAQILLRYLKDYAIPYAARSGDPADAPRAVYAVYNAGPRAVGRFAKPSPHPREKRVDERFHTLYRALASGASADLRSCSASYAE